MSVMPLTEPPIVWSPRLETGDETIDEHHRQLIDLVGLLWRAIETVRGKDVVREALTALQRYAEMHFAYEEEYFDRIRSPLAEEQRKEHRALTAEIKGLAAAYQANPADMPAKLKRWIETRLVPHMGTRDIEAVRAGARSGRSR